ncbi:MAG TPA: hypothetical protein VLG66_01510 [Alphaproteobacteria bacterium]|jgi:hypothetical protein|nr:hypothetical protein [Alphaproteobacteria bacterium]
MVTGEVGGVRRSWADAAPLVKTSSNAAAMPARLFERCARAAMMYGESCSAIVMAVARK